VLHPCRVIYASTLAYLVDANPGRSSSAVACNSFFRGCLACIFSQVALNIRNAIGDGGLYTLFSGLLVISCLGFYVIIREWCGTSRRGVLAEGD
jgi:Na+/melibiose symporter-like transporter